MPDQSGLRGPGIFVAIGGASGVGKDALIAQLRDRFHDDPRLVFVRRTVTRAADGTSEDHLSTDADTFAREEASGAFAVTWSAHGLAYGLPALVDTAISEGRVVVANVSRTVLPILRARYRHVVPIMITAERAVVMHRLAARGRESAGDIAQRLSREVESSTEGWIRLDNSGEIAVAAAELSRIIEAQLAAVG